MAASSQHAQFVAHAHHDEAHLVFGETPVPVLVQEREPQRNRVRMHRRYDYRRIAVGKQLQKPGLPPHFSEDLLPRIAVARATRIGSSRARILESVADTLRNSSARRGIRKTPWESFGVSTMTADACAKRSSGPKGGMSSAQEFRQLCRIRRSPDYFFLTGV